MTKRNILYAMPVIILGSLYAPMNIVQGIYAKHYGIALTSIAGVVLFVRTLDALIDPVIGYLSDKSFLKHGTRKPFMIMGSILLVVSGYFLYAPVGDVTAYYFAIWASLLFFSITLFHIPHLAWGGEIAHDSHEKTRIFNLRTAAAYIGLIMFYSMPLLPFWDTTEITPDKLRFSAIVSGVLMLPLLFFSMKRVSNSARPVGSTEAAGATVRNVDIQSTGDAISRKLGATIRSVLHNGPLRLFLGAYLFAGLGLGMWLGLLFIFVDSYLGMGASFSQLYLTSLVAGVVTTLALIKVSVRVGKKIAWQFGMLMGISAFAYTGMLTPDNVSYGSLLVLFVISTACFASVESVPQSILSEIVDYSTLKFRIYRGSTYFSLYMFVYKGSFGVGTALALSIAGWYGFDPAATSHTQNSVNGIRLAMVWLPIAFAAVSMVFISLTPITAERHQSIRRRLDDLELRSKRDTGNL